MYNFPLELEAMVLERVHPNTLYTAQQVKKSWKSYIYNYGHRLRNLFLSSEERRDLYRILYRIGRRPHMTFLWRKEIKMLKMTDYQFETHSCDKLMEHLDCLAEELRTLDESFINLGNSSHVMTFIRYQVTMLTYARSLDEQGALFHQKDGKEEQIKAVYKLCNEVLDHIWRHMPHNQQVLFNLTTTAKAVIAAYQHVSLVACRKAVDSIPGPEESNPASLLGALYRVQKVAFSTASATALALEEGLKQYKADMITNNLW